MRFVQAGVMVLGTVIYLVVYLIVSTDGLTYYNVRPIALTALGFNVLLLIVSVPVIVDSVRKVRAGKTRELVADVFVVKLASIPFFVVNFSSLSLLAMGGMLIFILGGFLLLAAVAIGTVLTYLTMLSTSIYGWASIVRLRRDGRIEKKRVVLYTILLFVFVADTVVGILLFARYRRGRLAAPAKLNASAHTSEKSSDHDLLIKPSVAEAGHDPATSRL